METGGARVLVAADGVGPESEVLAAEDIGPESEEVAAEDVVDPLLSVDSDPLLFVALDSQEPDEVIVLLAADGVVPDSQEVERSGVVVILRLVEMKRSVYNSPAGVFNRGGQGKIPSN